tara:strand:- start:7608 stop:7763 length:156 start_codon:yes stop_codon:yes gene_type:complete
MAVKSLSDGLCFYCSKPMEQFPYSYEEYKFCCEHCKDEGIIRIDQIKGEKE